MTPSPDNEFDVEVSSITHHPFDYPASIKCVRGAENLALVGPAGTEKSHLLVALVHTAVAAGHRHRSFTAAERVGSA